jgi:hypothetical protein
MGAAVSFIRIPTTETSVPFATAYLAGEGFGVDLAAYGYVEEEYLIPGAANVYEYGDGWELKVRNADLSFVTRLLVRRPAAASDFSGVVLVEPLHPLQENALGWFNTHPYLLRSGHAWAGLSCQPANIEVMKQWDPARYETLSFVDHGLGWEAMARVAQCLKEGAPGSPLTDFDVQRIYMSGGSYTGSWQRNFLADGFHDRARLADGSHVIDGFLIMISSGIFARTGMLPPNGQSGSLPVSDPRRVMQPHGVPVFEMLSEFEAETNYYGRRPGPSVCRSTSTATPGGPAEPGYTAKPGGPAEPGYMASARRRCRSTATNWATSSAGCATRTSTTPSPATSRTRRRTSTRSSRPATSVAASTSSTPIPSTASTGRLRPTSRRSRHRSTPSCASAGCSHPRAN